MLPIHKYKQGRASIYLTQSYHKHRTQRESTLSGLVSASAVALHAPILFYSIKSKFKTPPTESEQYSLTYISDSDAHSLSLVLCLFKVYF